MAKFYLKLSLNIFIRLEVDPYGVAWICNRIVKWMFNLHDFTLLIRFCLKYVSIKCLKFQLEKVIFTVKKLEMKNII